MQVWAVVGADRWHVAAGVSWAVVLIRLHVLARGLGPLIGLVLQLTVSCEAEKKALLDVRSPS